MVAAKCYHPPGAHLLILSKAAFSQSQVEAKRGLPPPHGKKTREDPPGPANRRLHPSQAARLLWHQRPARQASLRKTPSVWVRGLTASLCEFFLRSALPVLSCSPRNLLYGSCSARRPAHPLNPPPSQFYLRAVKLTSASASPSSNFIPPYRCLFGASSFEAALRPWGQTRVSRFTPYVNLLSIVNTRNAELYPFAKPSLTPISFFNSRW